MRREVVMKRKLYGLAAVIGFILVVATCGGIANDYYELSVGVWQLGCSFVLFMFGWYGLYLEHERSAKRR